MLYSYRSKLTASLIIVSFLAGTVSMLVGIHVFYKAVINEAATRVRMNLDTSDEMFKSRTKLINVALSVASQGDEFINAVKEQDKSQLVHQIFKMAGHADLDFAGIVNREGFTLCRLGPDTIPDNSLKLANPLTEMAGKTGHPVSGAVLLPGGFIINENPDLAAMSVIPIVQSSVTESDEGIVSDIIALASAVPIFNNNDLIGIIYGGIILNREDRIIDSISDTVFSGETYKGLPIGLISIFLNDIKVSTSLFNPDGTRAVGTGISEEIYGQFSEGDFRISRSNVLGEKYITAYSDINDIHGEKIGMLGLGILEQKYSDVKTKALLYLFLTTILGILIAVCVGYILADKTGKPVRRLIKASNEVSQGIFPPDIGPVSKGEIGVLQNIFMEMADALRRQRAENQNRLIYSEKQASVGRLAAGMAHEINNPLTGVLSYTHMLLKRDDLDGEMRSDLEVIAKATERVRNIVKGLLDFSRQTELDRKASSINRLVKATVLLLENEALIKGVKLEYLPDNELPSLMLDRNQMQSALLNMMINALDATEPGGTITVETQNSKMNNRKGVDVIISDTGSGIPPRILKKLFEPFFTTKEPGQGTGLGLAVSLGIIQKHGGTITVKSEHNKGTQFRVWLPSDERNNSNENINS